MDRPLWQIVLSLLLLGVALQRGVFAWAASVSGGTAMVALTAGTCAALALATALALWWSHPWTIPLVIALGVALATSALIEAFAWGVRPPLSAIATVLVVALSTGALALVLRHELGGDGSGPSSSRGAR